MAIVETQRGDVTVLSLQDAEISERTSAELEDQIVRLFQSGRRRLLLNLENVSRVDGQGFSCLLRVSQIVSQDGELALCSVANDIQTLIAISRLDAYFVMFHNEDEALAHLSSIPVPSLLGRLVGRVIGAQEPARARPEARSALAKEVADLLATSSTDTPDPPESSEPE